MKVLFIIGYPHVYAGSQKQLSALISRLPEGYEATVLLSREGIVAERMRADGFRVMILPLSDKLDTFGKALIGTSFLERLKLLFVDVRKYTNKVKRLIREEDFDILFCNDPRSVILHGPAKWLTGKKMVAQLHTEDAIGGVFWKAFEFFPDRFALISQAVGKCLSPKAREKAKVIYPGIPDVRPSGNAPEKYVAFKNKGGLIVGIFSSVIPFKGFHHLINALKQVQQRNPSLSFRCISCGDFPEEEKDYQNWIREMAEKEIPDTMDFLGFQGNPYGFMELCDVIVLPSVKEETIHIAGKERRVRGSEGLPTVILEGMRMGKVLVASDVAGVPEEIEDGKTGYLVPPSQPEALGVRLEKVLLDKDIRTGIGLRARTEIVKKFSYENYLQGFLELFEGLAH